MNSDPELTLSTIEEPEGNAIRQEQEDIRPPRRSVSSGSIDMQFATSLDKVTMPTPEAAKMARYADFPVSPSLGTADISIPIYEINTGRLRLPISLQYSTSGIKVSEISGPVGLGWHLNAGGVITRSISGAPDGAVGYLPMQGAETSSDGYGQLAQGTADTLSRFASGEGDTHYDRYTYSFLGHSCSFIVRSGSTRQPGNTVPEGPVVCLSPTDLVIELIGGSVDGGFRITDTGGTQYEFTATERSSRYADVTSPTPLAPSNACSMGFPSDTVTSWHLTRITAMDGLDSIRLTYDQESGIDGNTFTAMRESHHKSYQLSYKYFHGVSGQNWYWKAAIGGAFTYGPGYTPDVAASDWRYQIYDVYMPRMLRSISFRGGEVRFTYGQSTDTSSQPVRRSYRKHLSEVRVISSDGRTVLHAELGYKATGVGTTETQSPSQDRRELLTEVRFYDGQKLSSPYGPGVTLDQHKENATDSSYTFGYYPMTTDIRPMAQDLFGYYNGASGNTTLVPFRLFPDQMTITEGVGDRSYNAECAKVLSLKSITTKGGAYTEIRYEGNSVSAPSGLPFSVIGIGIRVASIMTGIMEGDTPTEIRTRRFTYGNPVLTIPAYAFTHNRFITVSEHSTTLESTGYGVWEGPDGPERTCTVTIGDQSSCDGAPLESAQIVYGKVSETVSAPGNGPWHRTEYTFNTAACVKATQYAPATLPGDHDGAFSNSSQVGFHHFQRTPPYITRSGGLPPSVALNPVEALYIDGTIPMLTMPVTIKRYTTSGAQERLYEKTENTYESASMDVLTGYSVHSLISVNTVPGHQNEDYRCLCDYRQTEIMTRRTLTRMASSETVAYADTGTDPAVARRTRTRYGYEPGSWTSETSCAGHAGISALTSYPAQIRSLSPMVVETTAGDDNTIKYTREQILPDNFVAGSRPEYVDGLIERNYRKPIGEVLHYGDVQSQQADSRFVGFRTLTLGGHPCILPQVQRTYRNGALVRTDLTVNAFDSMGNPTEVQEPGMPVRSYIWGYNGLYPIAEITGMKTSRTGSSSATEHFVDDYLSTTQRDSALTSSSLPPAVAGAIAQMRSLPGVHVSSRSMLTLTGPDSVTDPMGKTALYGYDPIGRLSSQRRRGSGETGQGDLESDWLYDFMRTDGLTNSIRQRTYTETGDTASSARTAVTRLDGLGRALQTSLLGASSSGGDIVQPFAPDFLDREDAVTYLPYGTASSNGGAYRSNAISQQSSFYISLYGNDEGQFASSRKNYEVSSRNKVESASLPGHNPGLERTVTIVDGITSAEVMKIRTDADITAGTPAASMTKDGHWPVGSLVKTTTTGPDGSVAQVFTNEFGSPVLERRLISGTASSSPVWSTTYYVRDIRDRVICVVTPDEYDALAAGSASSRSTSGCYVYMYDNQDRVIYRKLPNCTAATAIEYDDAGRITKETTGSRTFINGYDSLGRLVSRKFKYGTGSQRTLMEYTYDSYPSTLASNGLSFSAVPDVVTGYSSSAKGLKTYEKARLLKASESDSALGADSSATYVSRAFYYDNLGRIVQTVEKNHLGQVSRVSTRYDFTGNVIATRETQTAGTGTSSSASADTTMNYDRHGRLTSFRVAMDNTDAGASYFYDDIGRLRSRNLGSIFLPSIRTAPEPGDRPPLVRLGVAVTDSYTIQGWLSQRSSIPFTSELKYTDPSHGTAPEPGLAGNITEWRTYRSGVTSNGSTYAFTYDLMSRLLSSSRYVGDSNTATNPYTEKNITYFADSRIKTIRRYGATASSVQNLSFTTDNNSYDAYGNVTTDIRTGTVINWNILNLPRKIITAGIVSEYSYLADGTKVSMKSGTTTLHYLGSMVFSQAGSAAPVFESMAFSEGRIVVDSTGAREVHYHITDHLGSVRSVVKADGTVIAENDYYPYGKRINTASATAPTQKDRHTFSGKEDQALTPGGAPYLDFGARMYSPETGRWLSVDPMAEKYYGIGTHMYCAGNPVNIVDPDGSTIYIYDIQNNNTFYTYSIDHNTFVDENDNVYDGDNAFVLDVIEQLRILCEGETGKQMIHELAGSEKGIIITQSRQRRQGNSEQEQKNGFFTYKDIVSGVSYGGYSEVPGGTPYTSLGHELAHSLDRIRGTLNMDRWITIHDKEIPKAEIFATFMENRIRKEHGLPLRPYYFMTDDSSWSLGAILDAKERSYYYDKNQKAKEDFGFVDKERRYVF